MISKLPKEDQFKILLAKEIYVRKADSWSPKAAFALADAFIYVLEKKYPQLSKQQ